LSDTLDEDEDIIENKKRFIIKGNGGETREFFSQQAKALADKETMLTHTCQFNNACDDQGERAKK
jgi:hypothetical protein